MFSCLAVQVELKGDGSSQREEGRVEGCAGLHHAVQRMPYDSKSSDLRRVACWTSFPYLIRLEPHQQWCYQACSARCLAMHFSQRGTLHKACVADLSSHSRQTMYISFQRKHCLGLVWPLPYLMHLDAVLIDVDCIHAHMTIIFMQLLWLGRVFLARAR